MLTIKEAEAIVGPLSKPGKMPGFAYGLDAKKCNVGVALSKVPGSVCSKCYALKGNYRFPVVVNAQERRMQGLQDPNWVEAMVKVLKEKALKKSQYFRWHDSGDIQGVWHLRKIAQVCEQVPEMKFWMPTRYKKALRDYQRIYGDLPENLTVRLSAAMIDEAPPVGFQNTSCVIKTKEAFGRKCPAPEQNNTCGECRSCWDKSVECVSYEYH